MENKPSPGPLRRGGALAAIGFLIFCGWHYYQRTVAVIVPQLTATPSDFRPYHDAARAILHGRSPYLADGYLYPPGLAFLLTPFAPFDYVPARRAWFVVSQVFLLLAAVLVWRFAGRDWIAACGVALVWGWGSAATEGLALGQVGPLLALLAAVAMVCRRRLAGAAVGLGFAIKLFPGLLAFALLLRREHQALRWFAGAALVALLLPWAAVAAFLQGPVATAGALSGTPAVLSWSLPSVALRLLDPPRQPYPLPPDWEAGIDLQRLHLPLAQRAVSLAVSLATLCAGLAAMLRSVHGKLSDSQMPWAMAALVALALAASPVSWTHYQVIQYPGAALLLVHLCRRRQWGMLLLALLLASLLYPTPVEILRAYYLRYQAWTAHSPLTLYLWTSVTPLASLALFALFLRQASAAAADPLTGEALQTI